MNYGRPRVKGLQNKFEKLDKTINDSICIMYESNPRVPIPPWATPGDLTQIKSRVGGNLTFVQVPVPGHLTPGKNVAAT